MGKRYHRYFMGICPPGSLSLSVPQHVSEDVDITHGVPYTHHHYCQICTDVLGEGFGEMCPAKSEHDINTISARIALSPCIF